MDDRKYKITSLNFEAEGYFSAPSIAADALPPQDWVRSPWYGWAYACARARQGDFSSLRNLVEPFKSDLDGVFERNVQVLLGDAGSNAELALLVPLARAYEHDYELSLKATRAIATRGRLKDVPLILELYGYLHGLDDTPSIPYALSMLLDKQDELPLPDEFNSIDQYCAMVERHYLELADRLGTTDVYVWMGEPVSVIRMAKTILAHATQPHFSLDLRHRFEASTGIDCRRFYKQNHFFQPLTATTIVEDFLHSPSAGRYIEGVRYFFGHRVPD